MYVRSYVPGREMSLSMIITLMRLVNKCELYARMTHASQELLFPTYKNAHSAFAYWLKSNRPHPSVGYASIITPHLWLYPSALPRA